MPESPLKSLVEKIRVKWTDYLVEALEIVLSVATGFVVAALILIALGYDPGQVFSVMFGYGYSDPEYLLGKSVPLIMTALAFSIPLLAGVFNIGGESQLYVGALLGLIAAYYTHNPIIGILAGFVAGAAWGGLVALLRIYRNINEVIAAIMLNWTMYYIMLFLIVGVIPDPVISHESIPVPQDARLTPIPSFILAVAGALVIYFLLYYTDLGYQLRVSGMNPAAARYAGFDPKKAVLTSMLLGGGMAGYGGALLIIGQVYSIDSTMSTLYGLGFTGIGIGLLGRNHPIGIIFAAIFFSGLIIGGQWVELKTGAPPMLSDAIIGVIVIALAIPYAYRLLINYLRR